VVETRDRSRAHPYLRVAANKKSLRVALEYSGLTYLILSFRLVNNEDFRYDQFKRNYAEILYRWDMQIQRTEVMKYCSGQPEEKRYVGERYLIAT